MSYVILYSSESEFILAGLFFLQRTAMKLCELHKPNLGHGTVFPWAQQTQFLGNNQVQPRGRKAVWAKNEWMIYLGSVAYTQPAAANERRRETGALSALKRRMCLCCKKARVVDENLMLGGEKVCFTILIRRSYVGAL